MTEGERAEALHIVTGCTTREQFIAAFIRFCEGRMCFIPTVETRPIGSSLSFSVQLADGTPMLRGTCVVRAAWQDFDSPHSRPGLQLELNKMTPDSKALYKELLAGRIDADATRMVVTVRNGSVPLTLTLRPDGTLSGSGTVEVAGRVVTGTSDSGATFAPRTTRCAVSVLTAQ